MHSFETVIFKKKKTCLEIFLSVSNYLLYAKRFSISNNRIHV